MPGYEVIGSEELAEVQDVFSHGGVLFRQGFHELRDGCFKVSQFENAFGEAMGSDHALAVTSGTAAIRVALAALGIGQGDEVITQSFTFVATVEAIIESQATPICANIDRTLNLDPEDLIQRITPKTKAVIVVHMLGSPAALHEICEICRKNKLALIEDTAWGCGGSMQGRKLGTWGDIGTFSFDFAKTMTTGEGGMVLFKEEEIYKKAAAWHDHGHENNPNVPRWLDTRSGSGFNFRMMELQGAVGLAQLRKLPVVVEAQRNTRDQIWQAISDLPGIVPRTVPADSYDTADALVFLTDSKELAHSCREELVSAGLSTKILPEAVTWHFAATWDHMPELVKAHGGDLASAFKQSRQLLERAVSIPISVQITDDFAPTVRAALSKALHK